MLPGTGTASVLEGATAVCPHPPVYVARYAHPEGRSGFATPEHARAFREAAYAGKGLHSACLCLLRAVHGSILCCHHRHWQSWDLRMLWLPGTTAAPLQLPAHATLPSPRACSGKHEHRRPRLGRGRGAPRHHLPDGHEPRAGGEQRRGGQRLTAERERDTVGLEGRGAGRGSQTAGQARAALLHTCRGQPALGHGRLLC